MNKVAVVERTRYNTPVMENSTGDTRNVESHSPDSNVSPSPLKTVGEKEKRGTFIETIRFVIISLLIVIPFRIFIAQPFIVEGASMNPTFADGEYLIVDQISYRFGEPARGDVIVFRYPRNPETYFIKRIVGLPGETVTIKDDSVSITPHQDEETFLLDEPYLAGHHTLNNITVTLRGDEYFVMGDNREASSDSRSWGPLNKDMIIGTPLLRLLPIQKIDIRPGIINGSALTL